MTRWDGVAKAYLRTHPLCVYCEWRGKATPATCVDHRHPVARHPELFWDETNWAACCRACNRRKGSMEWAAWVLDRR